jgi:hypothetical protein
MGPTTAIRRLYEMYGKDATPPSQCVEFVFHTYYGFLVFGLQQEHRFRLPPDRARELLWKLQNST